MEDFDDLTSLLSAAKEYRNNLFSEIQRIWDRVDIDLARPKRGEILGGLIARQARFATVIVNNPVLWAVDIGRILLRCMVDTYITFAWLIKKGTDKDFSRFVEYGVGQEKLFVEHLKAGFDLEDPKNEKIKKQIDGLESWINGQFADWLLTVDVGNWNTISVRKMAEEADMLDVYNNFYGPHSAVLHGMWNAIEKLNLKYCENPLHRFHRVPSFEEPPHLLMIPHSTVNLMASNMFVWVEVEKIKVDYTQATEKYLDAMEEYSNPKSSKP